MRYKCLIDRILDVFDNAAWASIHIESLVTYFNDITEARIWNVLNYMEKQKMIMISRHTESIIITLSLMPIKGRISKWLHDQLK